MSTIGDNSELARVKELDDPNRCQFNTGKGQCQIIKQEGSPFCKVHQSSSIVEQTKQRMYRIQKYQSRINELTDHDQVKSLREEIGVTRMMLEQIINRCDDPMDLIYNSSRISALVMNIEKLVTSCHRLEQSTGGLLDKTKLLNVASQFIEIVNQEVNDAAVIENIANRFLKALGDESEESTAKS